VSFDVPGRARIVAVSRLGSATIPTDELVAQEGDIVHIAVGTADVNDVLNIIGAQASNGH
jgi:Trk K+ transport system NAD-binding subunit